MNDIKLTEAQIATLREMASYKDGYFFRRATSKKLADMGLAEELWHHNVRSPYRITDAGRRALSKARGETQ